MQGGWEEMRSYMPHGAAKGFFLKFHLLDVPTEMTEQIKKKKIVNLIY